MAVMPTVFEEAIRTGETTFPRIWTAIRRAVEDGASDGAIQAALRGSLKGSRPSQRFWEWAEDAVIAARYQSAIEADRRRRQFRLVIGGKAR